MSDHNNRLRPKYLKLTQFIRPVKGAVFGHNSQAFFRFYPLTASLDEQTTAYYNSKHFSHVLLCYVGELPLSNNIARSLLSIVSLLIIQRFILVQFSHFVS